MIPYFSLFALSQSEDVTSCEGVPISTCAGWRRRWSNTPGGDVTDTPFVGLPRVGWNV